MKQSDGNTAIKKLMKQTDLLGAGAVILVVVMLIIPLPPFILDLFITLNIAAALAILVSTLYMKKALDLSSFPSLLLLTTLFRLAINVSVTRLVLLEGDAGHLVEAFGKFVVGGNVVVGLVIFLILIVMINLIGGLVTGVPQRGRPFGEAASHFSLLTVGDGLTAQIPALMISVATGIIVTRAASEDDLGTDTAKQVLANKRAPMVAGAALIVMAAVPGLPKIPFILVGCLFLFVGWKLDDIMPKDEDELALAGAGGAALPPGAPGAP